MSVQHLKTFGETLLSCCKLILTAYISKLRQLFINLLINDSINNFHIKGVLGGLKLTRETPPGECSRKVKLKGIDGGLYKGWSMWFNSNTAKNLTKTCIEIASSEETC